MTQTGSSASGRNVILAKRVTAGAGLSNSKSNSNSNGNGKYPFPATLFFISEGLKRLRAARANSQVQRSVQSRLEFNKASWWRGMQSALRQWCIDTLPLRGSKDSSSSSNSGASHLAVTVLWRGMGDVKLSKRFWREGGSELACMSTSSDRAVAGAYAKSDCPLVLKIRSSDFMSCGVDICFLSMFPNENEFLYPPLTYLKPRARVTRGNKTIILLEPSFPT